MTPRHVAFTVHLGGKSAVGLFALCLVAFVVETQLTQYVQSNLGFRRPFFIFYVVHSAFMLMLPMHFVYLALFAKESPRALWAGLMFALKEHLSLPSNDVSTPRPALSSTFPTWRFWRLLSFLTAGMTVPSLLWFSAVSLAPVTDVTALWNANAFFAYLLSVKLFGLKWDALRLAAVVLATLGALAVVYGGTTSSEPSKTSPEISGSGVQFESRAADKGPSAPLVGDLLTLMGSILYAAYQVLYKIYATLPFDPEVQADNMYSQIHPYDDIASDDDEPSGEAPLAEVDMVYPPPFGLFPNLLTSSIGIATFLVLWIPMPILHYLGISTFELPTSSLTILVIAGIALSGVIFNGGFMILLGVWGPIVTSVGNLLTIVLVFLSDIIFGGAVKTITAWSLLGSASIVTAFGVLAYDMTKER
ncbi:hypothetical protein BKA93DRAFT_814298 [Sparassis latifolia]